MFVLLTKKQKQKSSEMTIVLRRLRMLLFRTTGCAFLIPVEKVNGKMAFCQGQSSSIKMTVNKSAA
jgi:hypothetical protein